MITIELVEQEIMRQCTARAPDRAIDPQDVARVIWPESKDAWRAHMVHVEAIAIKLAKKGAIEITQKNVVRDPAKVIRGPVRYRLPLPVQPRD